MECPYCKEVIKDDAIKCKHCHEFLNKDPKIAIDDLTKKFSKGFSYAKDALGSATKKLIFGPEKRMPTDENPLIIDLGSDHGYVTRKIIAKKDTFEIWVHDEEDGKFSCELQYDSIENITFEKSSYSVQFVNKSYYTELTIKYAGAKYSQNYYSQQEEDGYTFHLGSNHIRKKNQYLLDNLYIVMSIKSFQRRLHRYLSQLLKKGYIDYQGYVKIHSNGLLEKEVNIKGLLTSKSKKYSTNIIEAYKNGQLCLEGTDSMVYGGGITGGTINPYKLGVFGKFFALHNRQAVLFMAIKDYDVIKLIFEAIAKEEIDSVIKESVLNWKIRKSLMTWKT